jgi:hypothetical protein
MLELKRVYDPPSADDAAVMRRREHGGGFSLDATVRIEALDRSGLESQGP